MTANQTHKPTNLWASFALVLALLLTVFYLKPLIDEVNDQDLEVQAAEERLSTLSTKVDTLKNQQAEVEKMTPAEAEALKKQIPLTMEQNVIVLELRDILNQNQASLKTVTFAKPVNAGDHLKKGTANLIVSLPGAAGVGMATSVATTESGDVLPSPAAVVGTTELVASILKSFEQSGRWYGVRAVNVLYAKDATTVNLTLDYYFQS